MNRLSSRIRSIYYMWKTNKQALNQNVMDIQTNYQVNVSEMSSSNWRIHSFGHQLSRQETRQDNPSIV